MKRRSALALAAFLSLTPAIAFGLGLGDIRLNSALNQRLDAEIDLFSATDDEINSLRVRLADAAAFDRFGIERNPALSGFKFEVVKRQGGAAYVRVTSDAPLREPFITFLVEARWPRGRLLREYTVLLDPPVLSDAPRASDSTALVAQPVSAPLTATPVEPTVTPEPSLQPELVATPVVETLTASEGQTAAEQPTAAAADPMLEAGSYGPVKRNETLWAIASRLKPEDAITINQMMIALFRANPEAFRSNINHLKRGAILRVPNLDELRALSVSEANAEAVRHNDEWQATRVAVASAPAPEVHAEPAPVVSPPQPEPIATPTPEPIAPAVLEPVPAPATASGSLSIVAPSEGVDEPSTDPAARVADLEKQLAEARAAGTNTQRKRDRIARIEQGLGEARAALTVTSDTLAQVQDQTASVPAMSTPTIPSYAPTTVAAPTTAASPATAAVPATVAVEPAPVPTTKPKKGMLDKLLDNLFDPWVLGLLVGVPLFAAAVVMGLKRFKAQQAQRRAALQSAWPTGEESDEGDRTAVGTDAPRAMAAAQSEERTVIRGPDPALLIATGETVAIPEDQVEKTVMMPRDEMDKTIMQTMAVDTAPRKAAAPLAPAAPPAPEPASAATDTMVGGTPLKLDENDPISEADFHMAYGLYDQASDLIKKASQRDPARRDLKLKLLEIYFSAGNKTAFVAEAKTLRQSMGAAPDSDWANVAIFGKQIAPEEAMFSESGGPSAATLDFDASGALGTQTSVDLAFDEPIAAAVPAALAIPELPAAAPAPKADEPMEFDLGDFQIDAAPAKPATPAAPPAPKQGAHTDSQSDFDKALAELSSFVDTNIPKQAAGAADVEAGGGDLDLGNLELDDGALSVDEGGDAASEIDTKLDLARAYIDMLDPGSAKGILEEVIADGDAKQKAEAEKLLKQIG